MFFKAKDRQRRPSAGWASLRGVWDAPRVRVSGWGFCGWGHGLPSFWRCGSICRRCGRSAWPLGRTGIEPWRMASLVALGAVFGVEFVVVGFEDVAAEVRGRRRGPWPGSR